MLNPFCVKAVSGFGKCMVEMIHEIKDMEYAKIPDEPKMLKESHPLNSYWTLQEYKSYKENKKPVTRTITEFKKRDDGKYEQFEGKLAKIMVNINEEQFKIMAFPVACAIEKLYEISEKEYIAHDQYTSRVMEIIATEDSPKGEFLKFLIDVTQGIKLPEYTHKYTNQLSQVVTIKDINHAGTIVNWCLKYTWLLAHYFSTHIMISGKSINKKEFNAFFKHMADTRSPGADMQVMLKTMNMSFPKKIGKPKK